MRDYHSSLKGMSPLLTAILLVAVAVLVSIIIMNWMTILTKEQTAIISNKTAGCNGADISIQDVYIDLTSNMARLSVRNSGFIDDELTSGMVLNKNGENSANLTAFPISLPKGSLKNIEFNITNRITSCGNFSKAIVSSRCSSDRSTKAPKCSP